MNARPDAARHAALLLHAMGPSDRQWLLDALAPERRRRVEPLLQDLRELGLPGDEELLRPVLAAAAPREASAVARLESLGAAEAAMLGRALLLEPRPLAARLLAMRDWPWKQAVLASWSPQERGRLSDAGPAASSARLDSAICEAAVAMLASSAASAVAPASAARWQALRWPRFLRGRAA